MPLRFGIGGYLALVFALLVAIVGTTICAIANHSIGQDIRSHVTDDLRQLAQDVNSDMAVTIGGRLDRLRRVAREGVQDGRVLTDQDASLWGDAVRSALSDIVWLALVNEQGHVTLSSEAAPDVGASLEDLPKDMRATEMRVIPSNIAGRKRVVIALGKENSPSPGWLVAELSEQWLSQVARNTLYRHQLNGGIQLVVTDRSGRILAREGRKAERDIPATGIFLVGETPFVGERVWPDGFHALVVVLSGQEANGLQDLGWQVLVRMPLAEADLPAQEMRRTIYGWSAALIIVGALLGLGISQVVSQPLRRLSRAARQIADGHLVMGIPHIGTFAEVGQLSGALRDMVGALRSSEARLSVLNESLANHVRECDIEFRAAHAGLLANEAKLRAVIETAIDGVLICDGHGVIETANRSCEALFGWQREDLVGRSILTVMPDEWQAVHQKAFAGPVALEEEKIVGHARVVRGQRKDGRQFPLEMSLTTAEVDGHPVYVAMLRDISERVVAEERLFALATQDGLTGVRNRRYFLEGLESEIARCRRHDRPLCLLGLDADHFKAVNDTFGHGAGDAVLKALAETCRANLREVDMVGRMGGEEFAIAMPDTDLQTALLAAERLRQMVADLVIPYDNERLRISISIGVAALRPDLAEGWAEDMMRRADQALYQAKEAGRNRVVTAEEPVHLAVSVG